ncbi:hypothetical protein [Paraburkholderia lycopersici]|uniref:Uncharacterized protein n=1 Tax=Paraburkholderia lycopersici TaxID=416944 RepID=A0A1G6SP37_9BURK|nr:hypothetical protein [Paraburkholderia lycopersici]SDD18421.1 hypothetical protein SAMN05421548_115141 [Paraburkholderia lycopersici]
MKQHESPDEDGMNVKRPQHEGSEPLARRHPQAPRSVGRQGHSDRESGIEDTDRWGGDAYQERTKDDSGASPDSREGRR